MTTDTSTQTVSLLNLTSFRVLLDLLKSGQWQEKALALGFCKRYSFWELLWISLKIKLWRFFLLNTKHKWIAEAYAKKLFRKLTSSHDTVYLKTKEKIRKDPCKCIDICMVSGSLGGGGAERQVMAALKALRQADQNIPLRLICFDITAPGNDFYLPEAKRIGILPHEMNVQDHIDRCKRFPELVLQLQPHLKQLPYPFAESILQYFLYFYEQRPAVVHVWQDLPAPAIAACLAGVPRVVLAFRALPHPDSFEDFSLLTPCNRFLINLPQVYCTANSQAVADAYTAMLRIPSEKIHILKNCYDETDWPIITEEQRCAAKMALGIPPNALVVGGVQRMVWEKNPQRWINAAVLLASRFDNIYFVLYGDGPLWKKTKQALAERTLHNRLQLPGKAHPTQSALHCMDIFMLSSDVEGMPNVCVEAQFSGIPVVTTPAGGAPETILNGITGMVAKNFTAQALAEAVAHIVSEPNYQASASSAAVLHARESFAQHSFLENLRKAYNLDGKNGSIPSL